MPKLPPTTPRPRRKTMFAASAGPLGAAARRLLLRQLPSALGYEDATAFLAAFADAQLGAHPAPASGTIREAFGRFMDLLTYSTRRKYLTDFRVFASHARTADAGEAFEQLTEFGPHNARARMLAYTESLRRRGATANTIRRRYLAVTSFLTFARVSGAISWRLESEQS